MDREDKIVRKLIANFGLAPRFVALAKQHQRRHGGHIVDILVAKGFMSQSEAEKARECIRDGLWAAGQSTSSTQVSVATSAGSQRAAPEKGSGSERRRQRRVTAPPDFSVSIEDLSSVHGAVLHDLSKGGLAVETDRKVGVGRVIAVHVEGPSGTKVSCVAKVRHVRKESPTKHFLGLELVAVNPVQRVAVEALFKAAKRDEEEILDMRWLD